MKKKYYIYSSDKLVYKEVYKNTFHKYLKNFPLFILGILFCLATVYIISAFTYTPEEKKLLKEKLIIEKEFELLASKVDGFEKTINGLTIKDDSLYRTILGTEPLPEDIRKAGFGGIEAEDLRLGLNENEILNSTSQKLDMLQAKALILDHSFKTILEVAEQNKEKMLHIPAIMPIYNKDLKGTGAGFGMRLHPILGIRRMHEGIDFYAKTGTDVYATGNGTVIAALFSETFGNVVIIDHGYQIETYYAHLSKFNVKKGEKVKRGQVIGFVGNTGLSSGPHLHYEVHLDRKEIDPVHYFFGDLNPEQYKQIIKLSQRDIYSMD